MDKQVDNLVKWLQATYGDKEETPISRTLFHSEKLRVRYRIVRTSYGQSSVYCFVDMNGNIYKAATWNSPAKHIRGHVDNLNTRDLCKYSPRYLTK